MKKAIHFFFFGNYFYGCCAAALAVEAGLQQHALVRSPLFYMLLFCSSVVFYTFAYIQESTSNAINIRSRWYAGNAGLVKFSQAALLVVSLCCVAVLLVQDGNKLYLLTPMQVAAAALCGYIAVAYYGIPIGDGLSINVRNTGWFKPFAIGLVWATLVTYIPVLWYQVETGTPYRFSMLNLWFFLKNFMYISILAIMFDIKDYTADHNLQLKTFVVRAGIMKTIYLVIIPLTLAGLVALIVFASLQSFPPLRIAINCIPFIALLAVAFSMQRQKPIIYYLAVIDGLMLLKAVCGIVATVVTRQ